MRGALSSLTLIERTNSNSMASRLRVLIWVMPFIVSRFGVERGIPAVPKRRRGIWVMGFALECRLG